MAAAQSEEDMQETGATPATNAGSDSAPERDSATASAANRHAARRAAKAAAKAAKRGTAAAVPDEVQHTVLQAAEAYEKNSKLLWGGAVLVVAIAVGLYFASGYMEQQDHAAADALREGIDAARAQIVKDGEEPIDEDAETFPSAEARGKKAAEAFASAAKKHDGKLAGRWAQLGQASALAQLGKHAEAEKIFAKLTSDADPFIAARATEGVAFALEAQAKPAEAAARFEALAKLDNGAYKPLADYHRARMLIAQDKQRDAAGVLEALLKAERGKPEGTPKRFANVVDDSETLLTELSISLNDPTLRAEIPKSRNTGGGASANEDLMNQLRLQLGQGEGGGAQGGLTPELLKQLQQQLGGSAPGSAPAPAPAAP